MATASVLPASPHDRAFDDVLLVYNPVSSGGGEQKARAVAAELADRAPSLAVSLVPTEYAGHAREIAEDAARRGRTTLVVSVSGDGGYNEVVDGAMAGGDGHRTGVVVAVHPAGNANDHHRVTHRRPLAEAIVEGTVDRLDLLRLTVGDAAPRYAHSYIGLGVTSTVALALERTGKGSVRELLTTGREFARFRPIDIELEAFDGVGDSGGRGAQRLGRRRYDSLIVANLSEMAKYATLSEHGDPADGRFEIIAVPHRGRARLFLTGVRAAWLGLGRQPSARSLRFRTTGAVPVQLDGEVVDAPAATPVAVDLVPGALATVR